MLKNFERNLLIKSLLGFAVAVILIFTQGMKIPYIDDASDTYFKEAITKAGIAYATARVVNASVSVIQESKLQLEPAGVGVSIAVGQVLDPINDMSERLSDVLVTAITSLGLQKLLFEMSISVFPLLFGIFLFCISILMWFHSAKIRALQAFFVQLSVLLFIARLCLPFSSFANEFLYKNFFEAQINEARSALDFGVAKMDTLKEVEFPQSGTFGILSNSAEFLSKKAIDFKNAVVYSIDNAGSMIENLLTLTFLYVGIFLIQVLILPLFCFWLMIKAARVVLIK
jgi:hypothetical protein